MFGPILLALPKEVLKGAAYMKKVILSPATPHGEIRVPPSKSAAHRAILCAALSHGRSVVDYIDLSADILEQTHWALLCGRTQAVSSLTVLMPFSPGRRKFTAGNPAPPCGFSFQLQQPAGSPARSPGAAGCRSGRLIPCSGSYVSMESPVKRMARTACP